MNDRFATCTEAPLRAQGDRLIPLPLVEEGVAGVRHEAFGVSRRILSINYGTYPRKPITRKI